MDLREGTADIWWLLGELGPSAEAPGSTRARSGTASEGRGEWATELAGFRAVDGLKRGPKEFSKKIIDCRAEFQ